MLNLELERFGSPEAQRRAHLTAAKSLQRRWWFWVSLFAGLSVTPVALWVQVLLTGRMFISPFVMPILGVATALGFYLPYRFGIRHELNKLPDNNFCHECAYDLRGSTGRCPECGTIITPPGE